MALLFPPARSPGPGAVLCLCAYCCFSPAVKIHEDVGGGGEGRGFSVLGFFPGCVLPLGGRGMAGILFTAGSATSPPPCPAPAEPGSKFKAEVALLSNSVTLPARPPSKGVSLPHTHLPSICRPVFCGVEAGNRHAAPTDRGEAALPSSRRCPWALRLTHSAPLGEVSDPLSSQAGWR